MKLLAIIEDILGEAHTAQDKYEFNNFIATLEGERFYKVVEDIVLSNNVETSKQYFKEVAPLGVDHFYFVDDIVNQLEKEYQKRMNSYDFGNSADERKEAADKAFQYGVQKAFGKIVKPSGKAKKKKAAKDQVNQSVNASSSEKMPVIKYGDFVNYLFETMKTPFKEAIQKAIFNHDGLSRIRKALDEYKDEKAFKTPEEFIKESKIPAGKNIVDLANEEKRKFNRELKVLVTSKGLRRDMAYGKASTSSKERVKNIFLRGGR